MDKAELAEESLWLLVKLSKIHIEKDCLGCLKDFLFQPHTKKSWIPVDTYEFHSPTNHTWLDSILLLL